MGQAQARCEGVFSLYTPKRQIRGLENGSVTGISCGAVRMIFELMRVRILLSTYSIIDTRARIYIIVHITPIALVQTPHLQFKCARVINTTRQLISPHYLSSHPCRCPNSPPPLSPAPSCSNAPPKIEICQSNKHYQVVDITSLSF